MVGLHCFCLPVVIPVTPLVLFKKMLIYHSFRQLKDSHLAVTSPPHNCNQDTQFHYLIQAPGL